MTRAPPRREVPHRRYKMEGIAYMEKELGIYAFADEAGDSLDAQIAAMRRNSLQGIELRNVDGKNVSDLTVAEAKAIRARLEDAGLITWSAGSPIGKIGIEDEAFDAHLDKLKDTLEVADALGAKNIRMFSFYIPKGQDPAAWRGKVLDRVGRMLALAEGTGIALCHENEKGIYGDRAPRCADLLETFPTLRGVFDPANFVQCGQDTAEAWELLKSRTWYLHVKDAVADGHVRPAGQGIGHVPQIVRAYLAQGGTAMTIEPHLFDFSALKSLERAGERTATDPYLYASPDEAFDAAAAALRKILETL